MWYPVSANVEIDGVANHLDTSRRPGVLKSRQPGLSLQELAPELCHHILVLEAHEVYLADDTVCHGRLVLVCCVDTDPVQSL